MIKSILLILLVSTASGVEVPQWVLEGICGVESSSFYTPSGTIAYINKKRGRAGELGPFQTTPYVFDEFKKPGETFKSLRTDTKFAETVAKRILSNYYTRAGSWDAAIRAYNAGVRGAGLGRGQDYLDDVRAWVRHISPKL